MTKKGKGDSGIRQLSQGRKELGGFVYPLPGVVAAEFCVADWGTQESEIATVVDFQA